MMQKSTCPKCGKGVALPPDSKGRRFRCPACKEVFKAEASPVPVDPPETASMNPIAVVPTSQSSEQPKSDAAAITTAPQRPTPSPADDDEPPPPPRPRKRRPVAMRDYVAPIALQFRVIDDPAGELPSMVQAEVNNDGLILFDVASDAEESDYVIPLGMDTRSLAGNKLLLLIGDRQVTVALVNSGVPQARLARDLAAFMQGRKRSLRLSDYRASAALKLVSLLPLGIPVLAAVMMTFMRFGEEGTIAMLAWMVTAVGMSIGLYLWSHVPSPNGAGRVAISLLVIFLFYVGPTSVVMWPVFFPARHHPGAFHPPPPVRPNDRWVEFVDPEKQFRIEFPGVPQRKVEKLPGLPNLQTSYIVESRMEQFAYAFSYVDLAPGEIDLVPIEMRFDGAREGMLKKVAGGQLVSEQPIVHDGQKGREIVIHVANQPRTVTRLFFIGDRFYILVAQAAERPEVPDARRFFQSFRPLIPVPAANAFPGLLASWSFDEADGDKALDGGGNNHATLIKATRVPGKRGRAVQLKGDGYIDLGSSSRLNFKEGQAFTIAGWFKSENAAKASLVSLRSTQGVNANVVFLNIGINGEDLDSDFVGFHGLEGLVRGEAKLRRNVVKGAWQHFAVTHLQDGSQTIWIDGANLGYGGFASGAIRTDERRLGTNFDGLLDEICIFNRALTREEIRAIAGKAPNFVERAIAPVPMAAELVEKETRPALLGRLKFADSTTFTSSMYFSGDGKKIVAGLTKPPNLPRFDDGLQIWDADKHVLMSKAIGAGPIRLADGGRLILFPDGGGVQIYDTEQDKVLPKKFPGTLARPFGEFFCLSPDESFLLTIERDFTEKLPKTRIRKFDFKTGELLATWTDRVVFGMPVIHPGNACFAYATATNVQICSTISGKVLSEVPLAANQNPNWRPMLFGFSPDGRQLALSSGSAGLAFLELESGKITNVAHDPKSAFQPTCIAYSPNGKYLIARTSGVVAIDVTAKKLMRSWQCQSLLSALAMSPDGRQFAVARSFVANGPASIQTYDIAVALQLDAAEAKLLGVQPEVAPLPERLRLKE